MSQLTRDPTHLQLRKAIASSQTTSAIDIVYVVDDSSSIKDPEFAKEVPCVSSLMNAFQDTSDARYALITFSSVAHLEKSFTTNRSQISEALEKRRNTRQRGNTDMRKALDMAYSVLSSARSNATKYLFLLTDGEPDADPSAEADRIKFNGVIFFCIGFGGANHRVLNRLASPGKTFMGNNLSAIIRQLAPPPSAPVYNAKFKTREVSLQAWVREFPISLKEAKSIPFTIRLENVGRQEIPANSMISLEADDFAVKTGYLLVKPIAKCGSAEMKVNLPLDAKASSRTLPEYIQISMEDNNETAVPCTHDGIHLSTEHFIGSIASYQPPEPVQELNILLFGVASSGKSSCINSILTSLSPQRLQPATIGGTANHITTSLVRFRLAQKLEVKDMRVSLWDTWGLSIDNYQADMLELMLDGKLPDIEEDDRFLARVQECHRLATAKLLEEAILLGDQKIRNKLDKEVPERDEKKSFEEEMRAREMADNFSKLSVNSSTPTVMPSAPASDPANQACNNNNNNGNMAHYPVGLTCSDDDETDFVNLTSE